MAAKLHGQGHSPGSAALDVLKDRNMHSQLHPDRGLSDAKSEREKKLARCQSPHPPTPVAMHPPPPLPPPRRRRSCKSCAPKAGGEGAAVVAEAAEAAATAVAAEAAGAVAAGQRGAAEEAAAEAAEPTPEAMPSARRRWPSTCREKRRRPSCGS